MRRLCKKYNIRAFTLVEIILVVAIILMLAAFVMTGVSDWIETTKAANNGVNASVDDLNQKTNDSEEKLRNYGF